MRRKQGEGPLFMECPSLLAEGFDRRNSVPHPVLTGASKGRGGSDPDRALPEASGDRGLGRFPELAGGCGCCLGPAEA